MDYQELPPHPALRPYVSCLWRAYAGAGSGHRVLPDNCVDVLWQDTGRPAFVAGMMTRAIEVPFEGPVRTVAVRFRAGAASLFLSTPLHEITDQAVAVDTFWRDDAELLSARLWQDGMDDAARLRLIERYLLSRLRLATLPGGLALVDAALTAIEGSGAGLRIESLADRLGVSRQHLATQFRLLVGISPKLYARIVRFRRATAALTRDRPVDWARLAAECGYYDQSHLIRDFHAFANNAPERYAR